MAKEQENSVNLIPHHVENALREFSSYSDLDQKSLIFPEEEEIDLPEEFDKSLQQIAEGQNPLDFLEQGLLPDPESLLSTEEGAFNDGHYNEMAAPIKNSKEKDKVVSAASDGFFGVGSKKCSDKFKRGREDNKVDSPSAKKYFFDTGS